MNLHSFVNNSCIIIHIQQQRWTFIIRLFTLIGSRVRGYSAINLINLKSGADCFSEIFFFSKIFSFFSRNFPQIFSFFPQNFLTFFLTFFRTFFRTFFSDNFFSTIFFRQFFFFLLFFFARFFSPWKCQNLFFPSRCFLLFFSLFPL